MRAAATEAAAPLGNSLSLYTVYEHPPDYPDAWVVRVWQVGPLGAERAAVERGEVVAVSDSLEAARARIQELVPEAYCLGREEGDDLVIFETWV